MSAHRVTFRCTALFLLLAVAGAGFRQTQLLDPEPRPCRTQDNAADVSLSQRRRNEYPAGGECPCTNTSLFLVTLGFTPDDKVTSLLHLQVLMVLANVPAGLFGSLKVYLCPDGDAEVECLDRLPLQLADGSGTSYSLQKVPRTDKYEIPVILPDDITCPTCTLQLSVLTHDCANKRACLLTENNFCADITVRKIKKEEKRIFALLGSLLGRLFGA